MSVLDGTGAAQSLSGWVLAATARGHAGLLLHTFTTAAVPAAGDDPGGVQVTASGAQTAVWAEWLVPVARWSLWLTPPASEPYLHAAGWVRLTTH